LQHELKLRRIESERQVILPIRYKDLVVPEANRTDLRVENCLVVELNDFGSGNAFQHNVFRVIDVAGRCACSRMTWSFCGLCA
jgi:hypothetical protein